MNGKINEYKKFMNYEHFDLTSRTTNHIYSKDFNLIDGLRF